MGFAQDPEDGKEDNTRLQTKLFDIFDCRSIHSSYAYTYLIRIYTNNQSYSSDTVYNLSFLTDFKYPSTVL